MATRQVGLVLRQLRKLSDASTANDRSDTELLRRFVAERDGLAFEALVQRHGPMVWGVCRRYLGDLHASEDAFQATFLVLVRKARSLAKPELLANWLYGVAYRIARKARAQGVRRQQVERRYQEIFGVARVSETIWRELRPLLDDELSQLPNKYRAPLLLCYMKGLTKEEAARHLGWPSGTVSGRLARARDLLRSRLRRRGITLSSGALAVVLATNAAQAVAPTSLVVSTVEAALVGAAGKATSAGLISAQAAALTEGVLQAMLMTKLKIAAVLLLSVGVIATGAGVITHQVLAANGATDQASAQLKAPAPEPKAASPEDALKKARVEGKYEMLLAQIKVEGDSKTYGEFRDLGLKTRKEYAGHKNLPRGHWVYVNPYWYIWRDLTANAKPKRAWGPEQMVGEPDVPNLGTDNSLAWASLSEDAQDEWLLLEYETPIIPKAVEIHETFCPGAVVKITMFKLDGTEVEVWKGRDPTNVGDASGISVIPVKVDFKTNRIRVHIDSKNVPGWNEIDAVGLRDDAKKTYWVTAADASTTYARMPDLTERGFGQARIEKLEEEIADLRQEVSELKDAIKELTELLKKKQ